MKITVNGADSPPTQPIPHWGLQKGGSHIVIYRLTRNPNPLHPRFLLECNVVNNLSCCSLKSSILIWLGGSLMLPFFKPCWAGFDNCVMKALTRISKWQQVPKHVCESGWSLTVERYVGCSCVLNCFCYHPYLVFLLFSDLLSLNVIQSCLM